MIATLGLLSLLLLGGPASGEEHHPRQLEESLSIDNGLSRGDWGPSEFCSSGSYAFAFEIKYSGTGYVDDTCVNAIRLYCQTDDFSLTGSISSSEGTYGQYQGMRTCTSGKFFNGLRANVVPDMGTFGDDLGMDNLQMRCEDGSVMDGLYGTPAGKKHLVTRELTNVGEREMEAVHIKIRQSAQARDLGEWGSWVYCTGENRICGLQVRLEDDHVVDDDAGVTDVIMYCCS